jgi:chorismate mutase
MNEYRQQLDSLDDQIIELIGRRFEVSRSIGDYKRLHHLDVHNPAREERLRRRLDVLSERHHVDPKLCADIYDLILHYSKAVQE